MFGGEVYKGLEGPSLAGSRGSPLSSPRTRSLIHVNRLIAFPQHANIAASLCNARDTEAFYEATTNRQAAAFDLSRPTESVFQNPSPLRCSFPALASPSPPGLTAADGKRCPTGHASPQTWAAAACSVRRRGFPSLRQQPIVLTLVQSHLLTPRAVQPSHPGWWARCRGRWTIRRVCGSIGCCHSASSLCLARLMPQNPR